MKSSQNALERDYRATRSDVNTPNRSNIDGEEFECGEMQETVPTGSVLAELECDFDGHCISCIFVSILVY